jgi:hypothetical protein
MWRTFVAILGYMCHLSLSAMIFSAKFDPFSPWVQTTQSTTVLFYTLPVAVLFFADFVVYKLSEEEH